MSIVSEILDDVREKELQALKDYIVKLINAEEFDLVETKIINQDRKHFGTYQTVNTVAYTANLIKKIEAIDVRLPMPKVPA